MTTHTKILCQLVFSTDKREKTLTPKHRRDLFRYIYGVLKNKDCYVYRINGVEDHIHIAFDLHPSISLADLVKDIKLSSNLYIKRKGLFPDFKHWQEGYCAFTYSPCELKSLINYISNQEQHHMKETFRIELITLLEEHGVEFDEKYLL